MTKSERDKFQQLEAELKAAKDLPKRLVVITKDGNTLDYDICNDRIVVDVPEIDSTITRKELRLAMAPTIKTEYARSKAQSIDRAIDEILKEWK